MVSGMPWSCAAGMKCVPTRPLVVAPQIAKPPASSQNGPGPGGARAGRAERPGRPPGRCRRRPAGTTSVGAVGGQADVRRVVAQQQQTSGTTASAAPATTSAAVRQPWCSASQASTGRKIELAGGAGRGEHAGDQAAPLRRTSGR